MKSFAQFVLALLAIFVSSAAGFSSSFNGNKVASVANQGSGLKMEYIPSGMSKAQWNKLKANEKSKNKGKNLGKTGITSFKSRSFSDWQKSGGKNLFPVDPRSVKNPKDLPYMQRPGGSADDSDLGSKKGGGLFSFFGGKAKKEEKKEDESKSTNWWTL